MKFPKMKSMHKQAGVGLLEVLIAVLILAVGVLGISALQAITLKNSGSSASRTQAAIQVYSMLDIIRADRANAGSFNTNIYTAGSGGGTPGTLAGWLDGLQTTISPDAKGKVVCDGGTLTCTVGVQWNDTRATGAKDAAQVAQTIEVTSQL